MLSGCLLFVLFLIWACVIWHSTPELLSESERESDEFRYRYASTPVRRWLVAFGSCLLFAAIFSFITYSIAFLLWSSFLFSWAGPDHFGKFVFFLLIAALVMALTRVPKLRQFIIEACLFFQRYQFFPPLPSRREEDLMQQLERLPPGTLPADVEDILAAGTELEDMRDRGRYEIYGKLESVHGELEKIALQHNKGVVKMFYFGEEWELIDNQYKAIEKQMHCNVGEVDEALVRKIGICLYYAYGLLTRYIVETSATSQEVREKFRSMGFDVVV